MEQLEINEVAKQVNLKPHTLRYYESIGLIKNIKRNSAGNRVYSEKDLKWLEVIIKLRKTGMKISKMKEYACLREIGDETITERKNLLEKHLSSIENKIKELLEVRDYVAWKVKIYENMEEKING